MIYLIVNRKNWNCKIGYSETPEKRLSNLQTGNSDELELIKVIEGTKEDEKQIHLLFKNHKLNGEWFSICEEIKSFFDVTLDKYIKCYNEIIIRDNLRINKIASQVLNFIFLNLKGSSSFIYISDSFIKHCSSSYEKLSTRAIRICIQDLIAQNILFHTKDDIFYLNPIYYWNGSNSERIKELRMIVEEFKLLQKDEIKN